MRERLREKVSEIREKLLDPFNWEGLERDFEELLLLVKEAKPEERLSIKEEFEEVKKLLERNLSIVSGSLEPLLKRGGLFSRRV